jgi:MraZ protein
VSALVVYAGSGLSTIDGKARVTIPAELRDPVAESSGENIVCLQRHPSLPCLIGFGRAERMKRRADIETQWKSQAREPRRFLKLRSNHRAVL